MFSPEIPEDRSIVEVGEVRHVLAAVKLGRIDLAHLVLLKHLLLTTLDLNGYLLALSGLDDALGKATGGLVRHPAGLFGVIRLVLKEKMYL